MNGALGAKELGERLDYMLADFSNVHEIWVRFQRGEIFKKTRGLAIINNSIHLEGCRGSHAQEGAIGN